MRQATSDKQFLTFGFCNLESVCDLLFGIWDLIIGGF